MNQRLALSVLIGGLIVAACGFAAGAATIDVRYSPELGHFLVGEDGMTLYLFTPDTPGTSTCYGGCAVIWPPLLVDSLDDLDAPAHLAGTFGVTERTDGSLQVTYNGIPLYYWVADNNPGDTTGHGVDGVWFVVNPAPTVRAVQHSDHGTILVDALGMTLYRFANDGDNVSNCSGACAINWPPLIVSYGEPAAAPELGGELGLISRADGARQVTYNGMPLYGWINDQEPGDTTGHGVGGNWFVVNP